MTCQPFRRAAGGTRSKEKKNTTQKIDKLIQKFVRQKRGGCKIKSHSCHEVNKLCISSLKKKVDANRVAYEREGNKIKQS